MSGLSNLSAVSNALSLLFSKKLARQYNRMAVLGAAIPTVKGRGKSINFDVEMDGASAASYAEGADVVGSELNVDTLVPGLLSWGHYRSAFQVSETQLNAAFTSVESADAVMALLEERIRSSMTKLASVLNVDLWTGTGTDGSGNNNIVGLTGGALLNSGNYAGLSRVTYPLWKGNQLSNGAVARNLNIDLMDQMDANIFKATGENPNLIVCDQDTFRKYKGLFEVVRRVEGQGPLNRYDTSVSEVFYKGIPILRDKDAPQTLSNGSGSGGIMAFLNTKHLSKVYLPEVDGSSLDAVFMEEKEGFGSNGDAEDNRLALPFKIVPLAKNGDSLKFMIKSVLNLQVDRPATMGLIQDINIS